MPLLRPITYITHPRYHEHDTGGENHPETPERLIAINKRLKKSHLNSVIETISPSPADLYWIKTCHNESYLFRFEETALSGKSYLDHPDNQICFESYQIARLSAGAGLTGIDLLENNAAALVFCCVRPPGHHAEKSRSLGFCFFNNSAIAARYWQQKYKKKKILIFDFDAHHGNGTQATFEEDPDVFYISIHEHPTFSFPGTGYAEETGTGAGFGTTLNIPLPPGGDETLASKALTNKISPAVNKFKPEAIIISAGFDGHVQDDMSGLAYSTEFYGQLGKFISSLAKRYCQGKILTILEGGYHLPSLAAGVECYLAGLAEKYHEE